MSENEIKIDTFQKQKPHPILGSLPAYLKDPANYHKVKKSLIEAGSTKHSHGEVSEWAMCAYCQQRQWNRKELMRKLGFTSGAQYMAWRRTHEKIKELAPLMKWDKK